MSANPIRLKREYVKVCQDLGLKVTRVEHGKHIKVYGTHPETGCREHLLVGSTTGTDLRRSVLNFRACARSVMRATA